MNVGIVVLLLILSAFVRIPLPFTPVPITAQTLIVLLGGAYLGARLASVALGFYICLGIIGLPIFSGAEGGLGKFLGPTGGYLIGFIAASWFVGKLIGCNEKFIRNSLIFLFASTIILVCGMLYLALYLGVSFRIAFFVGMLPFVPGELIKVAVASGIYRKVKLVHSKKS
jgi:biotin transport system substrate-specific component